jgi:Uma2 family endonuclease
MSTSTKQITAEELFHMPDDGMRHELVDGELTTMTPAGFEHGAIIVQISSRLASHVRSHNAGLVLGAETGFVLARRPDTVRAPDVSFVCRERIESGGIPKTFYPGPPDLAVEVLSPGDTIAEVDRKVHDWLRYGTKLVWTVNPSGRNVTVYRSQSDIVILTPEDVLDGGDVLPGFSCRVGDIFVG